MIRVFLFLLVVALAALGVAWLAEHPGEVAMTWQGWRIETSLVVLLASIIVLVIVLMILWTLLRLVFGGPAALAGYFRSRRREKGLKALSRGMIATAAGDHRRARRYAREARKQMRDEPLTLLLQAQSAQLAGDRRNAAQAFEAMLADPQTEVLGLRGLFIEAQRAGDQQAARLHAERAAELAPGLPWAANALLDFQTGEGDWRAALGTIERNAENGLIDSKEAKRKRAVLLTAQAMEREENESDGALDQALEAHRLAPELVPAAVVAGRLAASHGSTRKATRLLEKTWRLFPHPDVADVYIHARPGDSARDRLKRARALAAIRPAEPEGKIAVAAAAIDARDWQAARESLAPLLEEAPSRRVCLLMAEIEEGEHGDTGRVREWLARALRAPRDPAWVADGYVTDQWGPVSPVSGRLDAFEWRTPPEQIAASGPEILETPARDEPGPHIEIIEAAPEEAPSEEGAQTHGEESRDNAEPKPGSAAEAQAEEPEEIGTPHSPTTTGGHEEEKPERDTGAPAAGAAEADYTPPRPPDDPGPEPEPERPARVRHLGP